MNHVERFKALMAGEPVDRLPRIEWAVWWDKTIERWRGEGLPETPPDKIYPATSAQAQYCPERYNLYEYFDLDPYYQYWFNGMGPGCPQPDRHGGAVVESEEDYERIREFLFPPLDAALDEIKFWGERQKTGDAVIWITLEGFFWFPRTLFGIEPHLMAFYTQPDLMHRMNRDQAAYCVQILDALDEAGCTPTFAVIAEDMSYNNGPMLSEDNFNEFLAPYYRQVVPELEKRGIYPVVDSDGDVTMMIPWLKDVGVRAILPLERQAGVDGMALREAHPDFGLIGHYDKMVMSRGEAAMREEFERLLPLMQSGRFIPSVDHQTPPGVSLDQYRIYLRLLEEYTTMAAQA